MGGAARAGTSSFISRALTDHPMIRDVYRFLIPLLVFMAICAYYRLWYPFTAFTLLALFVCYFFRNPPRQIPAGEGLVVSPADGKVVKIVPLAASATEPGGFAISIFLNIFNVHVNRSPIRGRLEGMEYVRGKFKAAYDDEASRVNEQNILTIQGDRLRVVVKQIAGLIARRVICWKREGDELDRGELFGLIRFGSRVDVLVPESVRVLVKVGDRVKGGSSILGELHG
jgi:phosphatidylserine decarboxylase